MHCPQLLLRLAHRFHGLKAANLSFVETILAKPSLMAWLSSIIVIVVTFIIIRFCLVLYGSRRSKTNKHLQTPFVFPTKWHKSQYFIKSRQKSSTVLSILVVILDI